MNGSGRTWAEISLISGLKRAEIQRSHQRQPFPVRTSFDGDQSGRVITLVNIHCLAQTFVCADPLKSADVLSRWEPACFMIEDWISI